jgi:hypothetical protein
MNSWSRVFYLLLVLAFPLVVGPMFARSQGTLCYFTSTSVNPPNGSPIYAGQPFTVDTTLSLTCTYAGNYLIRADLSDWHTSAIISTTRISYSSAGNNMMTLTNQATAPAVPGIWWLLITVNVLASSAPVAPQSQLRFWLNVVEYSETSLAIPSTESSSTISLLQLASSTSNEMTASLSSTIGTPQSNAAQPFDLRSNLPILIGAVLGLLVSVPIVILRFRKR